MAVIPTPRRIYHENITVPIALLSVAMSPSALRLWLALVKFVDRQRVCWPSNGRLLSLLPPGTTDRSLQRAKAELEGLALLQRERRHDGSGRETSCRYVLAYPVADDELVGEGDKTVGGEGDQNVTPGSSSIGSKSQKEPTTGEEASPMQSKPLSEPELFELIGEPQRSANGVPRAPETAWGEPEHLVALWNAEAPKGLPRIQAVSEGRRKKARAILRQFPREDWWRQVMREYLASGFLQGRKNGPGHEHFKADFDWLLAKGREGTENAVRVHEGRYRDGVAVEAPYGGKFG